jgi:hypothetical protein
MVLSYKIAVTLLMVLSTVAMTTEALPVWFDSLHEDKYDKRKYIPSGLNKGEK